MENEKPQEQPQDQAIQTKPETAVSRTVGRGHEEPVDQADLIIPRTLVIQHTPPKSPAYDPEKHRPGMIVNSITMEPLPKDESGAIVFVPVKRFANWVRFNAQNEKIDGRPNPDFNPEFAPGAAIWRSSDPADPRVVEEGKWGPNNEPPKATKFINYLAHVPGHNMPIVIGFAKTSYKAGKALTTLTTFAGGDLFAWKYKLRTRKEQNDAQQQYFVLTVEAGGKATEQEFRTAESLYNNFAGRDVKSHDEAAGEDPDPSESVKKPWQ